ncbi:TrkH family potassium uptake protein [Clostridium sp. MSJ-8]|uniref:TrkH family potassium uptake protein n=1 Tax=Clostridium sp. MSJ-8 TaxID=2841510 RepID=UPI001C0F26F9|nr:TrkH family potassium uptake protein [Clostridium sp. MSJ-8]MBU5488759.1 TrkH family potassium uptake protein [Clostridium sp. MSJ-8]
MENTKKKHRRFNEVQILALGFIIIILVGALILSLPISSRSGKSTNFLDSLFTATSSVCVTGLITLDTGTYWNTFGQSVILFLIEIGGLGFMSLTTFIYIIIGKKITLRDRMIVQEAINVFDIQGIVRMVKGILLFTVIVQGIGAIALGFIFIPDYGLSKGIFYSIFHSVSAFCNAGFDLIGNFNSITGYNTNTLFILVISALVIIGGLGFSTISNIYQTRNRKRLSVNTKLVITTTITLLAIGTIAFFFLEYNNPETLGNMTFKNKLLNAFFSAVTPRTAGFNSISTGGMTDSSKILTIMLMFIGGSPGSTAGGIKTTTIGLIILTIICVIKGRDDTEAFGRRFSKEIVYKAFTLFAIAIGIVFVVTFILVIAEQGEDYIDLLYEATSAFGTVGITTGVTQRLDVIGKIVIIISMYIGRVGPLTIIFALTKKKKKKISYKYPEGKLLIG